MLPLARFGRTDHHSTRVIFGAAGLGEVTQDEADAVLEILLAHGVNHLDTAASYGDAELRMGPWMPEHRSRFFLATKTGDRDGPSARSSLERSLEKLLVDQVDMIQLHNLVEPDEWETAFAKGGAVDALAKARDEGLTRFIGITGHGLRIPSMHMKSLERFDFDAVLFPYNAVLLEDRQYRQDVENLIEICIDRDVAVQTIKAIARRRFLGEAKSDERRLAWYEPLDDRDAISTAVQFTLSRDDLFLISSSDWRQLPSILQAAEGPIVAPDPDQISRDRAKFAIESLFDHEGNETI